MSRAMVGMIDRCELCGVRSDGGRQSRGWCSGLAGMQLASTQRENRLRDPSASGWALPDGQRPHSAEDDPKRSDKRPTSRRPHGVGFRPESLRTTSRRQQTPLSRIAL